jgi:hypothetical protein
MYWLHSAKKKGPDLRWSLPDRIFFGRGACHILAGAYLDAPPMAGFRAERIVPAEGYAGSHVYVTDGTITFDFHGYAVRRRLVDHHGRGWRARYPGWTCSVEPVDFDLLDTAELNARKMLGPGQYLHDALARARRFVAKANHPIAAARAIALANECIPVIDGEPPLCHSRTK